MDQFNQFLIKLFQVFLNFIVHFNKSIYKQIESDNRFYPVNTYLTLNPQIDPNEFFKKSNEIGKIHMTTVYQYPLNRGRCWNCGLEFSHECCTACKKLKWICDCKYICGFTYPTKQRNQFGKCKWTTNNM